MKKLFFLLAVIAAVFLFADELGLKLPGQQWSSSESDTALQLAFKNRSVDLQIKGAGRVVHILPDDNEGSRHQRFILETGSGQTLLVAHNIDLAPRVAGLAKDDHVEFYGEYEWNQKGGVIHWTHHDPGGRHADGWLLHRGKRYQ